MARFDKRHLIERRSSTERSRSTAGEAREPDEREPRRAAGRRGRSCAILRAADRRAQPADLPRGPVHDPRALSRADRPGARPHRDRHARGKRTVANIASFLRFAADWQAANPSGTLAGFVAYLDAYQAAGGELPTSVELTEDVDGVRLMTLYQAKGLEFPIVIVPQLLDGEWPTQRGLAGSSRASCCARPCPAATSTRTRSGGCCTSR